MSIQPRFARLVVGLLPVLVIAGCLRAGASSLDDQPVLADPAVAVAASAAARADSPHRAEVPDRPHRAGRDADRADRAQPGAESGDADTGDDPVHPAPAAERPEWLGTIPLPNAPDDGSFLPTPPELEDRRLPPPPSDLPEPAGEDFAYAISDVPADVVARSTWRPECPVPLEDLRYLTVTHWGFDDRVHTGEIVVHANAAEQIAGVFARLHAIGYPLEEVRVISQADMNAISSGDANVSSAFVCRRMTGSTKWSEHSYGLAIDLNPFHNPYVKGSLVIPGLAGTYADRGNHRPGMIQQADDVIATFRAIGWKWGGDWSSSRDWMHFSASGR